MIDLFPFFLLIGFVVVAFVFVQLLTILWLLKENSRLQELAEENEPPF